MAAAKEYLNGCVQDLIEAHIETVRTQIKNYEHVIDRATREITDASTHKQKFTEELLALEHDLRRLKRPEDNSDGASPVPPWSGPVPAPAPKKKRTSYQTLIVPPQPLARGYDPYEPEPTF